MNHTQWLRLQAQGELVCATLKDLDYQVIKQRSTLHWQLIKEGQADYLFCWLPAPISHWVLLPNDCTEVRSQLLETIHQTLAQSSYQPLFPVECYESNTGRTTELQFHLCQASKVAHR
ncbi:MAG TPA: hypothetical protein V6C95_12520 [Coleofasciculaceae cyanobacterium]